MEEVAGMATILEVIEPEIIEHARRWAIALLEGVARRLEAVPTAALPDILAAIGEALAELEKRTRSC
jgi:hypothetical protein